MIALLVAVALQCPDGSPPPCARATPARASTPDPNVLAILPFRVTTADTLLGEGAAELLAMEFTGEGSPRAVDMATTLSAWRRVGGSPRSPLALDAARRLARELGAGRLLQGSIVGLGGRISVTASIIGSGDGAPLGEPARGSGTVDSLDVLLRQLATTLLAAAGGRGGQGESARLTRSPEALRAYIQGLSYWRRGRWNEAQRQFEAAIQADSNFAQALYQRWFTGLALLGGGPSNSRMWAIRERLGPRERRVVETMIAEPGAPPRSRSAIIEARRRLVGQLADSPDAWYLLADYVFHYGFTEMEAWESLRQARDAFERAVALDSQPTWVAHVWQIAIRTRDTVLLRRASRYFEQSETIGRWSASWVAAMMLRDEPWLARLRRQAPSSLDDSWFWVMEMIDAPVPAERADEVFRLIGTAGAVGGLPAWLVHHARGRVTLANRAAALQPNIFAVPQFPYFWVSGEPDVDLEVIQRFGAHLPADTSTAGRRRNCVASLARAVRGDRDTTGLAWLRSQHQTRCAIVVSTALSLASGSVTDAETGLLDSAVSQAGLGNFLGYEHRLLAQIYESGGDVPRALRAVRMYPRDFMGVWAAPTVREEGRLALMAGDTTGAIRAWRYFMELRSDAEGRYAVERDSVRAILRRIGG